MLQTIKQWWMPVYSQQFQLYLYFVIILSFVAGDFFFLSSLMEPVNSTEGWLRIQMEPRSTDASVLHHHVHVVSQLLHPSASSHFWVLDLPSKQSPSEQAMSQWQLPEPGSACASDAGFWPFLTQRFFNIKHLLIQLWIFFYILCMYFFTDI